MPRVVRVGAGRTLVVGCVIAAVSGCTAGHVTRASPATTPVSVSVSVSVSAPVPASVAPLPDPADAAATPSGRLVFTRRGHGSTELDLRPFVRAGRQMSMDVACGSGALTVTDLASGALFLAGGCEPGAVFGGAGTFRGRDFRLLVDGPAVRWSVAVRQE